jgi:hypothetical protein
MRVLDPGHKYSLTNQNEGETIIQFYRDGEVNGDGADCDGPINQEYLRALINRIQFLDKQKPWPGNQQIIHHAREMIRLHELRAFEMKLAKQTEIEKVPFDSDGHIKLSEGFL